MNDAGDFKTASLFFPKWSIIMSSVFYHGPDVSLVHRRDCFEDMSECVKTQSQTIRTSSDGGRVSVSYQRASRDWDIRRHAGREVAGGSRARYMDGYSRHSPLPKQQQYLDPEQPAGHGGSKPWP